MMPTPTPAPTTSGDKHSAPATPNPAPAPFGPFYSTWGPEDGPILASHESPVIGVVPAPDAIWPVGIAYPAGLVAHRWGPAQTFRLVVAKIPLEGSWLCLARRFVPLGDAAEPL